MEGAERIRIRDVPGGAVIAVKVVPGSSRDRLMGPLGEALKIATATAPEKGKANAAVARILAEALGLDRRAVTLHAGQTTPRKQFLIANLTAEALRQKLRDV